MNYKEIENYKILLNNFINLFGIDLDVDYNQYKLENKLDDEELEDVYWEMYLIDVVMECFNS